MHQCSTSLICLPHVRGELIARMRGAECAIATGLSSMYRLRMGDYRVLFDVEGGVIVIRRIGNRKDVYD